MKKAISLLLSMVLAFSVMGGTVVNASGAYDDNGKYIYRNDTFEFDIEGDPMHMTDEEFFGQWDNVECRWRIDPYFKYSDYPEMAEVEEAVKEGDYELAKEELLDYYISKKDEHISPVTSVSSNDRVQSELLMRNFYASSTLGTPLGIVKIGEEWSTVSVNVGSYLKDAVANGYGSVTFVIASIDKSNTPAEIKSRESDTPATLTLIVNGLPCTFTVAGDSYMRAGDYADTNFGWDEFLYAQEYGYRGHWDDPSAPWGDDASDTKRTYIKFDISCLKKTDMISSAKLEFTARTAPGGDLSEKELLVYGLKDSNWDEDTITWDSCSDNLMWSCNDSESWDYITTGDASTKGTSYEFQRGTPLVKVAKWYDYTRDEKYAYTFLRQLMSLINNVGVNEDIMNCYDMSAQVRNLGHEGFARCYGSEYMTPELFTAILKHYVAMTEYISKTWVEPKVYSDIWATYANGALYRMAVMYPELKFSDWWLQTVIEDNRSLLSGGEERNGVYHEGQVLRDGQCIELSRNKTLVLLSEYSSILNICRDLGNEVPLDYESLEVVKSIVKNMLYQSAPGYYGFNMGDSVDYDSIASTYANWYKLLPDDDDELGYVAASGKIGSLPEFTSISYPLGLRTYMRSDWSEDAVSLCFTGKSEGNHGHSDLLSVSMWAYGEHLLTDPGYSTGEYAEYMRSAQQHNLVTINGGSISEDAADCTEEQQELNEFYDFTTYSSEDFEGADYNQRSVLYVKNGNFFIINDYIVPQDKKNVNTYKQFWHMHPDSYVSNYNNQFVSDFGGVGVIVAGADMEGMEDIYLEDSLFAPASGTLVNSQKAVYEKQAVGAVSYSTVVHPVDMADYYDINTTMINTGISDNRASAMIVSVTNNRTGDIKRYYYYHLNDETAKQVVTIGKYTTDADALLVEEDDDGKVLSVFIYNGTFLTSEDCVDLYLFKSFSLKTLSYELNGSNMVGISTDSIVNDPDNLRTAFTEEDLKDLTIYGGPKAKDVIFNDDRVSSIRKSGGYVYFDDDPIIMGSEEDASGLNPPASGGGSGGSGSADIIDETTPHFKVGSAIGIAGNTVKIPVEIKNNPGVISVQLKIHYDDEYMTLKDVVDRGILGNENFSNDLGKNPYTLSWENDMLTENICTDGKIAELVFAIDDNAPAGEYYVDVYYNEALNKDIEEVDFLWADGSVVVVDYILGDVNGDGIVSSKDRMILSRYLADWVGYEEIDEGASDVNIDGKVSTQDRMILARHLAVWEGYETLPFNSQPGRKYTVTFDSSGGSAIDSLQVEFGKTISKPADPKKSGYTFAGWYADSSLTNAFSFNTRITSDITLYAKWNEIPIIYNVTFVANGGSAIEKQAVESGNYAYEPEVPVRDGYRFDGWYKDSGFKSLYDFSAPVNKHTMLYAKWVKVYTVTFETNGVEYIEPLVVDSGSIIDEPDHGEWPGYYFLGWYKDSDFFASYNFSTKVYKDYTLYAKWIEYDESKQQETIDTMSSILHKIQYLRFYGNAASIIEIAIDIMTSVLEDAENGKLIYDDDYILDNYGDKIGPATEIYHNNMTDDEQVEFYSYLLTELGGEDADTLFQIMFGISLEDAKDKID